MRSKDEIQADLTRVETAIAEIVAGKRIINFRFGDANSQRIYGKQEVSLQDLLDYKDKLQTEMSVVEASGTTAPTFKSGFFVHNRVNRMGE